MKAVEVSLEIKGVILIADSMVNLKVIGVSYAVGLNVLRYVSYIASEEQGPQDAALRNSGLNRSPLGVLAV